MSLPPILIANVVVVYPLVLRLAVAMRRGAKVIASGEAPSSVTVVITCHNEDAELPGALDAILAQDWNAPPQIIVGSDASTDGTDAIAHAYEDRGVTVYRAETRSGKTAVENAVSDIATGDIVVFLDATARPRRDSVARVVGAFADPTVGVASGREVLTNTGAEEAYVSFEERLRALETQLGGIVGASGSLFAIRRELFVGLEPFAPRDFASVLLAHHRGLRAVSVAADCLIRPVADLSIGSRRRSRTMSQGVLTLLRYRHWLRPAWRHGFAIKLFCHKVGRWLFIPCALLGTAAATGLLVGGVRP